MAEPEGAHRDEHEGIIPFPSLDGNGIPSRVDERTEAVPASDGAADRRGLPRRKKQIRVLVTDAVGTKPATSAWVLDRSPGGLGLSSSEPLAAGTKLSVRPVGAPSNIPWVEVEVKNCRRDGSIWAVGCQFVWNPTWEIMLHFG